MFTRKNIVVMYFYGFIYLCQLNASPDFSGCLISVSGNSIPNEGDCLSDAMYMGMIK